MVEIILWHGYQMSVDMFFTFKVISDVTGMFLERLIAFLLIYWFLV